MRKKRERGREKKKRKRERENEIKKLIESTEKQISEIL